MRQRCKQCWRERADADCSRCPTSYEQEALVQSQPAPVVNGTTPVIETVLLEIDDSDHPAHIKSLLGDDLCQRDAIGRQRYGTSLQPYNGRDALRDCYEEVLDAWQYAMQEAIESDSPPRDNPNVLAVSARRRISQAAGLLRQAIYERDGK